MPSVGICVALLLLFLSNNALLFTPQNILSEATKFLRAQNTCCGSVFICLLARCHDALCFPVLRRLRFLLKEPFLSESGKFGLPQKVLCVPSLHAWSLISGNVRSKLLLALAPSFMHPSCIAAWKNKERRDGDVQEILAGLPLKTSTIAKQRHLPATTNTLEINYLWNAVKNSLIFSFYPIKMPNRFKPFTRLVSNTLCLFLLPSFRPYFFFPFFWGCI